MSIGVIRLAFEEWYSKWTIPRTIATSKDYILAGFEAGWEAALLSLNPRDKDTEPLVLYFADKEARAYLLREIAHLYPISDRPHDPTPSYALGKREPTQINLSEETS